MKTPMTLLLLLLLCSQTNAAIFCVENSQQLKDAFQVARNNGEDDEIRLKSGDYLTIGQTQFIYSQDENESVEISGGWFDFNQFGCFTQSINPMNTTLDADGQSMVMMFTYDNDHPNFNVKISNLTFANGYTSSNVGSGMQMALPDQHNGRIFIDRTYFIGNDSDINGALTVTRADTITVTNSVFQFNTSVDGSGIIQLNSNVGNNGIYFINNTVINNNHDVAIPEPQTHAGLNINISGEDQQGHPKALIANNLFWGNEDQDMKLSSAGTIYLKNNNYQASHGQADVSSNNISANPMLAPQILNFTPLPGSPLIDRGLQQSVLLGDPPYPFEDYWGYGQQDFDGFNRVINRRVDIGAVEAPPEVPIFEHGFDD